MTTTHNHGTVLAHRIVAGIVLTITFIVLGSVFTPSSLHAKDEHGERQNHAPPRAQPAPNHDGAPSSPNAAPPIHAIDDVAFTSAAELEQLPLLGTLESAFHRVEVYGSPAGPLYSVFDCGTDRVLARLIDRARVADLFPEISMPELAALESASAYDADSNWLGD